MNDYKILANALSGERLSDVLIVDCHGHLDFWKAAFPYKVGIEDIIEKMDIIGIDVACLNKWNCPDIRLANNDVGKAIKRYPERIVGFASTGTCLGREKTLDELKRCFDDLGFKGIKVHAAYDRLPLRDQYNLPEYQQTLDAIWTFAAERHCPVLCHGFLTPEIAKRYPEAIFIMAHACGERVVVWQYAGCKNVYFDTASSGTLRGNIEYFVKNAGAERVLYGSDLPYADPAYRIGQVIGTRVKDEQLKKILGENMAKILDIRSK